MTISPDSSVTPMQVMDANFVKLAEEAKAIYKAGKTVLVNCEIFERYLEGSKVE